MQVKHGLPRGSAVIDDEPVPLRESEVGGNFLRHQQQMAEQWFVLGAGIGQSGQGLFRDDQDMSRRLGVHITKRQAKIVFKYDGRRNLAPDNLHEYVVGHGAALYLPVPELCARSRARMGAQELARYALATGAAHSHSHSVAVSRAVMRNHSGALQDAARS